VYRDVTISVIIPCLNEEEGIADVLRRVPDYVDEIVVVDNGSEDRTGEVAQSLGAVVIREPRRGYGASYHAGFRAATKDIILTADGDGSHPIEMAKDLVDCLLNSGVGFVSGSRFPLSDPDSMAFRNYIGNQFITFAMSLLFGQKFCDGLSGMWCFKRELLRHLRLVSYGWNLSQEIKLEAALHPQIGFREYPIPHHERMSGQTKLMPWKAGVDSLLFLIRKRFFMPRPGQGPRAR
jgi:glycosyltransferase involved in cell wall biosynthesis